MRPSFFADNGIRQSAELKTQTTGHGAPTQQPFAAVHLHGVPPLRHVPTCGVEAEAWRANAHERTVLASLCLNPRTAVSNSTGETGSEVGALFIMSSSKYRAHPGTMGFARAGSGQVVGESSSCQGFPRLSMGNNLPWSILWESWSSSPAVRAVWPYSRSAPMSVESSPCCA